MTTEKEDGRRYRLYVDGVFRRRFSTEGIARFWAHKHQTEYGADSWRIEKDGVVLDGWNRGSS